MAFLPRRLLAVAAALLSAAAPAGTRVDPLTIADDDFARHRDPAEWRGLSVHRLEFAEERTRWRLFRITNTAQPRGPLWFVPHDDEDAGFEAGLAALRRHGGTMIAVDSAVGGPDGIRRNRSTGIGRGVDPNRVFHDGLPRYAGAVLAPLARGGGPIIALHSNSRGYDHARSTCARPGDPEDDSVISIRFCSRTFHPVPSRGEAYPYDDDDALAILPFLAHRGRDSAFCGQALVASDAHVSFERIVNTDGSLSNYAALTSRDYLNFEVPNPDGTPAALAAARDRLLAMIEGALAVCRR